MAHPVRCNYATTLLSFFKINIIKHLSDNVNFAL